MWKHIRGFVIYIAKINKKGKIKEINRTMCITRSSLSRRPATSEANGNSR